MSLEQHDGGKNTDKNESQQVSVCNGTIRAIGWLDGRSSRSIAVGGDGEQALRYKCWKKNGHNVFEYSETYVVVWQQNCELII